jgi:hypothetical protein
MKKQQAGTMALLAHDESSVISVLKQKYVSASLPVLPV